MADVVGAPLEKRHGHVDAEGLRELRNILLKELILQRFSRRGNNDGRAREERRREIRKRLPGAGPGLGDERALGFERLRDLGGEFNLAFAPAEMRACARERSVGCECGADG